MTEGYDITPIPLEKRKFRFADNFAIWLGAGISIAEFWAGALLVASPISLGLKAALVAIIIGHIIGNFLLAFIGIMGSETGLPTMVISRKALGIRGSHLVSALNYFQLIGWTAVMLVIGALALNNISSNFLGLDFKIAWVLLLGVLVIAWTLIGPEKWRIVEKIAVSLLSLLLLWLTVVVFSQQNWSAIVTEPLELSPTFWLALDLVIAMPVSWAPLIADYTRFSTTKRNSFWGPYVGYFLSSSFLYFLGAFSNLLLGQMDPIAVIAFYGLGIPAMLIIVFSTTTTTFLDVYSAALTYKNIQPESDARKQVIFVGVLGIIIAAIFPVTEYEWFLLLIGGAFVSLTAILVVDFLVDRMNYDPEKVFTTAYTYDWMAIAIWAIGFTFYMMLAAPTLISGLYIPIFAELGGFLGSSIPTLLLVAILHGGYRYLQVNGKLPVKRLVKV